jgi:tetratricopeptide (TPR) repeat protein
MPTVIFCAWEAETLDMRHLWTLLALFFLTQSLWAVTPESIALNNQAMVYYEAQDWLRAIEAFEKAVEQDPSNYLAHYNLACTLALAKKIDPEVSTWSRIGLHLKKSLVQSPNRLARIRMDPDLKDFRKTFYYQSAFGVGLLAGRSLEDFLGGNRLRAVLERGQSTIEGTAVFSLEKGLTLDFAGIGMRFTGMWSTHNGELRWVMPGRPEMYAYYAGQSLVFPLTPWGPLHIMDFE